MSDKPTSRKTAKKTVEAKPYHHGSLPHALLDAAEAVLRRDGIGALTLRSIAREAGVSHTAPQHHFGDTRGVLSELAALGNLRLAATMAEKAEGARGVNARRKGIARGYIAFALKNPDLMRLMLRNEMLDDERPALIESRRVAGRALAGVFGDVSEAPPGKSTFGRMPGAQAVTMTVAWAYVHGLAMLLINGRLKSLAASAEGIRSAEDLVDAAIEHAQISLGKLDTP
ncbi:Transcriptional regulator, TetR family [Candidatus Burkholderia verschuerenii]|uniref:Transcriptional regulator, TetR family n=1 Tax=Candidatus Burkholderia verschuerenii TaxID=242163 RepID=A0A0L0M3R9_9BURK|nr:TetR/AcrR family transcriptional regulator [Candidatus Burkholderia verschuerenii]KND57023.1 Transcriptional regulator, TetR family [Candidatus Burkholderia verschuerenii]